MKVHAYQFFFYLFLAITCVQNKIYFNLKQFFFAQNKMDCDICYESFDHLERKPLLLLRCAHTLCASCVSSLTDKKCPSCSGIIEDTQTNWSMLKVVVDSKFEEGKFNT